MDGWVSVGGDGDDGLMKLWREVAHLNFIE